MKFSLVSRLALFSILCCTIHAVAAVGVREDETRNVRAFHGVSNSGSIAVKITFGNRETVRLSGDDELIADIETVVEDGILKIRYKNNRQPAGRRWERVTAYVTAQRLDALAQSGSGSITVDGSISGEELNVALSGSGAVTFATDVAVCNASISGSGRIAAQGSSGKSNVSVSGSGRFAGDRLKSRSASLKLSGSGNISIHADDQLDASISGSGYINYSGNAQTNVKTSGSGRLRKV